MEGCRKGTLFWCTRDNRVRNAPGINKACYSVDNQTCEELIGLSKNLQRSRVPGRVHQALDPNVRYM